MLRKKEKLVYQPIQLKIQERFLWYNVIVEILWNEFFDEVSPNEAQAKAKELLPECQAVFSNYNLNDDFAETTEYQSLYTELVGTILILLENELQ